MCAVNARNIFLLNKEWHKICDDNKPFYIFKDSSNVAADMKNLIDEFEIKSDTLESAYIIKIMTMKFLIDVGRCAKDNYASIYGIPYLKKAVTYIRLNYGKKISNEDVASECGITSTHLQRLFKQAFNKSILLFITETRLENAKRLLAETDLANGKIAALCGFGGRQQLIHNFKKFNACTPDDYRREMKTKRVVFWTSPNFIEIV